MSNTSEICASKLKCLQQTLICQQPISYAATSQLTSSMLVRLCSFSSATICLQEQSVNSNVYNQLISNLSALAAPCQPSSDADSQLGLQPLQSTIAYQLCCNLTSPTNCQLDFTISTQVQCVRQCILSAPLYSVSSEWSLLALLQSVCSAAICQLSSLSSFNSIVS